ncbi:MAG TPA: CHASE3 domain-containing protein [Oculatellaceae cyanobacterium]
MRISQQLAILTIATFAIIVVVAASAYYCVYQLTESHAAVNRSAETLAATQEVCYHMAYASAAQRAYIITGFDTSLDAYKSEVANTNQTMALLNKLAHDDPEEAELAAKLERGLNDRMASLETTLKIYETKGQAQAFNRIRGGVGLAMMQHTVELANALRDYELHEVTEDRKRAEINAKNTQHTLIIGSLVAITIVCISNILFSRNLTNAVNLLLRASQNLALNRFETLVAIENNDELGDLAKAFNSLAGNLREHAMRADEAEERLAKAEADLTKKAAELDTLHRQIDSLQTIVQESQLEQELSQEHFEHLIQQVKESSSLAERLGDSLRHSVELSRRSRVATEGLDRRCSELTFNVSAFSDQAETISKSINSVWNHLPETKDLVSQLASIEHDLSIVSILASLRNEKDQSTLIAKFDELKQVLAATHSKLNINVTQLQQTARQALDASTQFESGLKNVNRPLVALSQELVQLVEPTLMNTAELANTERLSQKHLSSFDQLSNALSLLDVSKTKQRETSERIALYTKNRNNGATNVEANRESTN